MYRDSIEPIPEAGQALLFDDTLALGNHLLIVPAPRHMPGHSMITLAADGTEALLSGDVMHHPIQVHFAEWSSAFVNDPELARMTRRCVLQRAGERGNILCPTHFGGFFASRSPTRLR